MSLSSSPFICSSGFIYISDTFQPFSDVPLIQMSFLFVCPLYLSICPCFHHLLVYQCINLSNLYPSPQASIHSFVHPCIQMSFSPTFLASACSFQIISIHPTHLFIHPFLHSLTYLSIHPSIQTNSSTYPFTHPLIRPSLHSFIHPLIHPSIHTSMHPSTHPLIHPPILP